MCGLVGIASSQLVVGDVKKFRDLLYFDQIRGPHSTGVASVNKKGVCEVYKRALPACDYLQLSGASRVLSHADTCIIGHNRYATMGAKDDNNAHPFTHGDITLAHNGTLTKKKVHKATGVFPTDSESIAYALTEEGSVEDVLESLEGAYALTWHNALDNTLHFARNAERPLYLAVVGVDLMWASEKAMLELVAEHHKCNIKELHLLPIGEHVTYNLDSLAKGGVVNEFTPKKLSTKIITKTYMGGTHGQQRGGQSNYAHNSIVGSVVTGFLHMVKDSGFFKAATLDGKELTGVVSKDIVPAYKQAMATGDMIRGTVSSSSSTWKGTVHRQTLALSAKGLELCGLWEEDKDQGHGKCSLCLDVLTDDDDFEVHGDESFHGACLDLYLKTETRSK